MQLDDLVGEHTLERFIDTDANGLGLEHRLAIWVSHFDGA